MPIEFRCTHCNKLLQTPDNTAGKHAKCPMCETLLVIPAADSAAEAPAEGGAGAGLPPGPPGGDASPFAAGGQPRPGPDPTNPYQSPAAYAPLPMAQAPVGQITHTLIDVGDIFSRTWEIFKQQWGMIWVSVLIVMGINFAASIMLGMLRFMVMALTQDHLLVMLVAFIGNIASIVLSMWLSIGQAAFLLQIARGRPADVVTIFLGGPKLLTAILASLLFGLIILGGFLLLIIPAIIFALMFSQYFYLIVDRNVGVMDSLNISREITRGNKLTLFAIGLLSFLITLVALIPCFLGLLVTVPYFALMNAVVYLAITGQPTAYQIPAGTGQR